jgi:hypothetical protein
MNKQLTRIHEKLQYRYPLSTTTIESKNRKKLKNELETN